MKLEWSLGFPVFSALSNCRCNKELDWNRFVEFFLQLKRPNSSFGRVELTNSLPQKLGFSGFFFKNECGNIIRNETQSQNQLIAKPAASIPDLDSLDPPATHR